MTTTADRPSVPRVGDTITTAEQVHALPDGSAVVDKFGDVGQKVGGYWHYPETAPMPTAQAAKYGPLTVLYVPGEPSRPSVTDNARAEGLSEALAKYEAEIKRASNGGQIGAAIAIQAGASLAIAVRDALAAGPTDTTKEN